MNGVVPTAPGAHPTKKRMDGTPGAVDKQAFLQLLVTQLKNQNPLDPADNQQFLAQLAQFNTLEQMQNMARASNYGYGLGLLGRMVTALDPDGQAFTGHAVGFRTGDNGEPLIKLVDPAGTRTLEVTLDAVRQVEEAGQWPIP